MCVLRVPDHVRSLYRGSPPPCVSGALSNHSEHARGFLMPKAVTPVVTRFWPKVDCNGTAPSHQPALGRCWVWTGAVAGKGYGRIGSGGRGGHGLYAHRISWEMHYGAIPSGMSVLHRCDVMRCVRPEHLFLGTLQDNTDDKVRKLRHLYGQRHPMAKLNEQAVLALRARRVEGALLTELADAFGITFQTASNIVRRKTWRRI